MSRIDATFAALRAANRRALIPFITAGDPEPGLTVPLMHALVEGGADILELGVPFSDPMADGPTIQRASERALAWGMSLSTVLALVHQFRRTDSKTPVVLMGYANPIEAFGQEAFAQAAQQAGVDGVLVVDYPPEECREFSERMKRAGIDPIFLLAPTSSERRFDDVAQAGRGYLYYVSLKGVTGSGALDLDEVTARIPHIRARVGLPVGVGFGIRDAQTAARIAQVADAVVIGSRLIEEIEAAPREEVIQRVRDFIHNIRRALDDAALPVLETPT